MSSEVEDRTGRMKCPVPPDEQARLEVVARYRMFLSVPEQGLDDLTLLASRIFGCPFVYLGVVDADRVALKARVGIAVAEIPREGAFDAYAIAEPGIFVVKDASTDPRFADHPWVTATPRVRFYAAAPLVTIEGHALGTLAVMDRMAHQWSSEDEKALRALARVAMNQIQLSQKAAHLEMASARSEPDPQALEAALAYADGMMEVALGPLLVLDGDLVIVKGNPPFYDAVGKAPDDVDKRFVSDILPDPSLRAMLEGVNESGIARRGFETEHAGKPLRVNAAKLQFEGGGIPLVVVALDRRRTGAPAPGDSGALAALGQVEEPAGRIASFTQLLSMRYSDKLEPDARRWLEEIVFGSFRIQEILRAFAGKSPSPPPPRVESPPPALRPASVPTPTAMRISSDAILNQVLKGMKSALDSSGGKVTRDPLPSVGGRSEDLQEVFENLLRNAIRYRGKTAPQIHLWAELDGDSWVFAVSDNGVGIDPGRAKTIFVGPGRGLPASRAIVERGGGKIWVMSQPGDGATFFFTWPK